MASARRERSLRQDVERYSGCLDALPGLEGEVLALRGGLGDAAPATRGETAAQLDITTERTVALERTGIKRLRNAGRSGACGSGAAESRRSALVGGGSIPPLQPAVLLVPRPALTSPAELARPDGRDDGDAGAAGEGSLSTAGGGSADESGGSVEKAAGVVGAVETSSKTAGYLIGFALLALLLAMMLFAWRRREAGAAPRLADQTGSAVVWRAPNASELPEMPVEPPPVAPEVSPAVADASPAVADAPPAEPLGMASAAALGAAAAARHAPAEPGTPDAPAKPPAPAKPDAPPAPAAAARPPAQHPRRPAAVAAASLISLGVALLRARRRR